MHKGIQLYLVAENTAGSVAQNAADFAAQNAGGFEGVP